MSWSSRSRSIQSQKTPTSALLPQHTNVYGVRIGLPTPWQMLNRPLGSRAFIFWPWVGMTAFVMLGHSLSWAGLTQASWSPAHASFCRCYYGCNTCRALLTFGMLLGTQCSFPASPTTGLRLLPLAQNTVPLLLPLQQSFPLALRKNLALWFLLLFFWLAAVWHFLPDGPLLG